MKLLYRSYNIRNLIRTMTVGTTVFMVTALLMLSQAEANKHEEYNLRTITAAKCVVYTTVGKYAEDTIATHTARSSTLPEPSYQYHTGYAQGVIDATSPRLHTGDEAAGKVAAARFYAEIFCGV